MTNMIKHFPRWLYHHSLPPVVVHSPDEQEALGEDWVDSPALVRVPPAATEISAAAEAFLADPETPQPEPKRKKKRE